MSDDTLGRRTPTQSCPTLGSGSSAESLLVLCVAGFFAAATFKCLRLAYAEYLSQQPSVGTVTRAIHMEPGNADYHLRRAALLSVSDHSQKFRQAALKQALALNPRNAHAWMELGLLAELSGKYRQAEACLLEAARQDATYQPRNTLANFYFRRAEPQKFWPWVYDALRTAPSEATPLFRLCWNLCKDANFILGHAIPDRPATLREYLRYLLQSTRASAVEAVADRILHHPSTDDLPLLLACCDLLLETRDVEAATRIWNSMIAKGIIEHEALLPAKGIIVTNGSFRTVPRSHGFDWRIPLVTGLAISRNEEPPALRLTLSGRQPEKCELLWQYLPLLPFRRYTVEVDYQTVGIAAKTGLHWVVFDSMDISTQLAGSSSLAADDWGHGKLSFTAPGTPALARLVLIYRRAPGTTRIMGQILLQRVKLIEEPRRVS